MTDGPGRRAYIQARRALTRKRTTCTPERMAVVLQFPDKKEAATNGTNQDDQT